MRKIVLLFGILFLQQEIQAQNRQQNLIIITLDGLRWQEVFNGADEALLKNKEFTRDSAGAFGEFWDNDPEARRRKLFPFLWSTVLAEGSLYGNRQRGCRVNNANPYWFSYPGYNEIFTGYPDDSVNSNDKRWNKNENVLEFLNRQKGYKGKVAAFATWDVFPYILNDKRSGVYVNADTTSFGFSNETEKLLNDLQKLAPRPLGVRPDIITYLGAREYLKAKKPKVLYIAFDETDDLAHEGMYDQYLKAARAEDNMIADLWQLIQSLPEYRNNTTLFITCDHGRGDLKKEDWRHHGQRIPESNQIWFAAIGPGIPAHGEVKEEGQYYQAQFAGFFAALLGFEFKANHPVTAPLGIIKN
ncbi:MAG: alkaline phosphatase family protein [Chitinophagaceae bacterium]